MSQAQILDYAKMCLILVLQLSLIPIAVATVIGILVSLLQALTQSFLKASFPLGHLLFIRAGSHRWKVTLPNILILQIGLTPSNAQTLLLLHSRHFLQFLL